MDGHGARALILLALLCALVSQIAVADVVFVVYVVENDWRIDGATMQVWLGAAVVQVIGLAWVVIKYLVIHQVGGPRQR